MAQKVFISYKYADGNVAPLFDRDLYSSTWVPELLNPTTARNYVTELQKRGSADTLFINKGEEDDNDLSKYSESTIQAKLYARIYDSSVTAVLISPNMKEPLKDENMQWIPREISYSLKEFTRSDRTSHSNSLIFVVLPDRNGNYAYFKYMRHFTIVQKNIDSGYACVVKWSKFIDDVPHYIFEANLRQTLNVPYKNIY